jgi:AcrR family transcriptional regulator
VTEPKNQAPPRDRSRRRRRTSEESGGDTTSGRGQIIEAAISSILEVGFYRSSTNEIARRANVSWGAVQYHFGTREALMMAVVETLDHRFESGLESAEVTGDTPLERISSLYSVLRQQYDTPAVFVRLQIVLNLQHDPDTSHDVNREIAEQARRSEATVRRLLHDAIGPGADKENSEALFHALRGYALSMQLARALPTQPGRRQSEESTELFLRALAGAHEIFTDQ